MRQRSAPLRAAHATISDRAGGASPGNAGANGLACRACGGGYDVRRAPPARHGNDDGARRARARGCAPWARAHEGGRAAR